MTGAAVSSDSSGNGSIGTRSDSGGCGGTSCGEGVGGVVATLMPVLVALLVMMMVP